MAGKTYVIDFGFNLDAGAERIGFPLSAGLVDVPQGSTSGEGTPQWLTKLRGGDSIGFRVWDQTPSVGKSAQPLCFQATWTDPSRFNQLSSPLEEGPGVTNPIVFSGEQIVAVDVQQVKSSVFSPAWAGWIFGDPARPEPPLGRRFQLAETTSRVAVYYFRAQLDVVIDGTTVRSFHWDPEIVVGAGGGEPPPDQPGR